MTSICSQRLLETLTSIPIIESRPLDWPISSALNTEARAISSRSGARNVPWRLEPYNQQTLHKREKLAGAPAPLFQNQVALKDAEIVKVVPLTEVVEKVSFVIAVEPLAYGLKVCLSDVQERVTIWM